MRTDQAIGKRVSIREYENRPVEKKMLEHLIDAGRKAPSARAVEPWEFIILTDKNILEKISGMAPNGKFIKDASACIVIICQDTKYYLEDGCAATENILLAAADSGLGACWVAGDKKPYADELLALLGAPGGMKLVSLISVGWPKEAKPQQKRRSLKEVIHWERF
jgi:nitroreductase